MASHALRRLITTLAVLVVVSLLSFVLAEVTVDPAVGLAGAEATSTDIEVARRQHGLDRPWISRYLDWAGRAAAGDLGQSLHYKQPVARLILERMPVTLILAACAMGLALLIALPLGVAAALRPGGWVDRLALLLAIGGQALPSFWTALLLIVVFGVNLGWLPISGAETPAHFVMPALTLALFTLPVLLRLTRAGMIETLQTEYVRAATARGLRPGAIVLRHALRNAMMPLVAVAAVQFGYLLGGSIVTEQIFAMHGVGYLAWQAVLIGDTAIVQAIVLLMAVIYAALTFAADLLNAALDPRTRIAA